MRTTLQSGWFAALTLVAAPAALAQPASSPPSGAPAAEAPRSGPRAGGPGRGAGGLFDQMDGNKDGRVTWDEAWTYVQQRFAAADADKDGALTRQEAEAVLPGRGGRRPDSSAGPRQPPTPDQAARRARFGDVVFRSLDANRDGRITLDEVRPAIEARFRGLDANGDNAIDRTELPQRREGRRPESAPEGAGKGERAPAPPQPR